jgi:hypothetical protein
MDANKLRVLRLLMERMKEDPAFMAYALDVYCEQQELDESGLVTRLATTSDAIVRLALCKRPDSNSPKFAEQVQQIANYTSISQPLLLDVLKASEGLIPGGAVVTGDLPAASLYAALFGLYKRARRSAILQTFRPPLVILTSLLLFVLGYWAFTWFFSPTKTKEPVTTSRNEGPQQQVEPPGNPGATEAIRPDAPQSDVPGSLTGQTSVPPIPDKSGRQPNRNDRRRSNPASSSNPKGRRPDPYQVPVVRLKLSEIAELRDEGEPRLENRSGIRLRRRVTRLQIELLQDGGARVYDVSITGPFGEPLLSARTRSLDGKFLRVRLDLRALEPGRYHLCLSWVGNVPVCYSLVIEP